MSDSPLELRIGTSAWSCDDWVDSVYPAGAQRGDCRREVTEFVEAMDVLEDKLGPLLIQLPYYNRQAFSSADDFLKRLQPFLESLPGDHLYALETRNKNWLDQPLLDRLREHKVALALTDQAWMPAISQIMNRFDPLTGEFVYIRWLGDRKGIEAKTQNWNRLIVDRTREMETWVNYTQGFITRRGRVYGYFNNHYTGFAPGSIELFWEVWEKKMA